MNSRNTNVGDSNLIIVPSADREVLKLFEIDNMHYTADGEFYARNNKLTWCF